MFSKCYDCISLSVSLGMRLCVYAPPHPPPHIRTYTLWGYFVLLLLLPCQHILTVWVHLWLHSPTQVECDHTIIFSTAVENGWPQRFRSRGLNWEVWGLRSKKKNNSKSLTDAAASTTSTLPISSASLRSSVPYSSPSYTLEFSNKF